MLRNRAAFFLMLCRAPEDGAGAGAAEGGGEGGADAEAAAAAAAAGEGQGSATPWWKGSDFTAEEQQWLAARGLTEDDPTKVLPKIVKGHRAAEQRIGRGLDTIIDKPGKDQPVTEWLRANAAALGLPDKEDGYTAQPPADWPKEAAWDTELEAKARKVAFELGVPPQAHQAYVSLFAEKVKEMDRASRDGLALAQDQMMNDLRRDYGEQVGAVITKAKQGAQFVAEKAGLSADALTGISQVLSDKGGDANTIRFMAAIADMMGEDNAAGIGKGGALTMTPAEARAELARFQAPDGEYGRAVAEGNVAKVRELSTRREQLAKIAART
ncbi:hypothetical protein [Cereibacter azotoformans]|uniref:hypothetical protein n=1 Tax=Cereibacter azotoformans TaxID=43057 RepID=UPI000C6D1A30|nr:hypothetical protein [Cereibacter azotoformans]